MADTKKAAGAETKDLNPPPAPAEMLTAPPQEEVAGFQRSGYVVERPAADGGLPSFLVITEYGAGWTWEPSRATVFDDKDEAKALIAPKTKTSPAGVAAGEGAKIAKVSN